MDHFGAGCVEQLYGGGGCKNRIGVYFISETGAKKWSGVQTKMRQGKQNFSKGSGW